MQKNMLKTDRTSSLKRLMLTMSKSAFDLLKGEFNQILLKFKLMRADITKNRQAEVDR